MNDYTKLVARAAARFTGRPAVLSPLLVNYCGWENKKSRFSTEPTKEDFRIILSGGGLLFEELDIYLFLNEVAPAPEGGQEVAPAPEGGQEVASAPEKGPEVASAPEKGPEVASAPEKGPEVASAPEEGPEVAPAPEKGPKVAPAPEKGPEFAPDQEKGPEFAPDQEKGPEFAPDQEKGPEVASDPEKNTEVAPAPEKGPEDAPAPEEGQEVALVSEKDQEVVSSPKKGQCTKELEGYLKISMQHGSKKLGENNFNWSRDCSYEYKINPTFAPLGNNLAVYWTNDDFLIIQARQLESPLIAESGVQELHKFKLIPIEVIDVLEPALNTPFLQQILKAIKKKSSDVCSYVSAATEVPEANDVLSLLMCMPLKEDRKKDLDVEYEQEASK